MSTISRIFHLIEAKAIDQKAFAVEIGTTEKVVSKWKSGALRSYTKYLGQIVSYFGVPADYFLERGIFQDWDTVMKYPVSVCYEIKNQLPDDFKDSSVSSEYFLVAWLDKKMCYGITGEDEIDLIRWFYRAIQEIKITKTSNVPEIYDPAKVDIIFRPEYRSFLGLEPQKKDGPTTVSDDTSKPDWLVRFNGLDPDDQQEVIAIIEMKATRKKKP